MSVMQRVELEPAFVLHVQPWRETSQIVEVFSHSHGRVGMVARGSRRPASVMRGLLNPFCPLRLSWSGRGELATLRDAEPIGLSRRLDSERVMAGFYINELLLRLLERGDSHPLLFARYSALVGELAGHAPCEPLLRNFELQLLEELGYALNLQCDAVRNEALVPEQWYEFRLDQGAVPVDRESTDSLCFRGADLLSIGNGSFAAEDSLKAAKRLLRAALNFHLGQRVLQTRRVAAAMKR